MRAGMKEQALLVEHLRADSWPSLTNVQLSEARKASWKQIMRSPLARTLALVVGVCAALALICECFDCIFSVHRAQSSLMPLTNIACMHSGSLVPSTLDQSGGLLKSWGWTSLGAYSHCDDALHEAVRVMVF